MQNNRKNVLLFGNLFIPLRPNYPRAAPRGILIYIIRYMNINKNTRLEVVKMIVSSQELSTQEELLRELERSGFPSTQATLSRDLRQLRIAKGLNEDGLQVYMLPEKRRFQRVSDTHLTVQKMNRLGALSVKFSGNMAVVRTPPGHAAHVAYDIDNAEISEVLGTVAGDDTVFIVLAEDANRQMLLNQLNAIDTLKID